MKKDNDFLVWINAIAILILIIGVILTYVVSISLGVSVGAIPAVWLAFRYFFP